MSIVKTLTDSLGPGRVCTDEMIIDDRRHDYWVLSHLDDIQDRAAPRPACVVQPRVLDDVVAIVNACRESATPLIPFGLGSGVCGGVVTTNDSVLLDMSMMNGVHFIDDQNLLAGFEAGKNGMEAEKDCAARGLTIGHWPQSIEVSSVGGWIATRASGQFSTGYGNIEDIVYGIQAVLPNGDLVELGKAPRASAGPDLRHLMLGSEGTLGVITGVTLSLRRLPEKSAHSAFYASSMSEGLELQRQIIQSGWQPVVMRQYDTTEATRNFPDIARGSDCLFFAVHEGPAERVEAEVACITKIATTCGCDPAPTEVVAGWLKNRNHVPTWDSFLNNGIVLDTIEISSRWDLISTIYDEVIASVSDVEGVLTVSGHSSHVYRSGINIYFTFAARPENNADMADTYRECWRRVMEVTANNGGGVAHHHGIGRVRKDYLVRDVGDTGIAALRAIKSALDPVGFMNPGVLIPDA